MQKFYLVWIETREIQCVDNASAITNSLDSIFIDKASAILKALERIAYYRLKINLKSGTVCGGYFDEALITVYEAEPDDVTGELKQTDVIYKENIKL
jgi:hypothetical protein